MKNTDLFTKLDGEDVFVHGSKTKDRINPGDVVLFNQKESYKKKGKYEAFNVRILRDPNYLTELLDIYLTKNVDDEYKKFFHITIYQLTNKLELLLINPLREILEQYVHNSISDQIESGIIHSSELNSWYSILKELFRSPLSLSTISNNEQDNKQLYHFFQNSTDEYVLFVGWLNKLNVKCSNELIFQVFEQSDQYIREDIFELTGGEYIEKFVDICINTYVEVSPNKVGYNYSYKYEFLSSAKHDIPKFINYLEKKRSQLGKKYLLGIYSKCSINLKFEFCLSYDIIDFSEEIQDFIIKEFKNFDESYTMQWLNKYISANKEKKESFAKKIVASGIDSIYGSNFKELLSRVKNNHQTYNSFFSSLSSSKKLELWCDNEIEKLDIEIITEAFSVVNEYYKEMAIKKILFYYNENSKAKIDTFVKESLHNIDKSIEDLEIYFILKIINSKINNEEIKLQVFIRHILEILHDQKNVNSPNFTSTNLLEKCNGRTLYNTREDFFYKSTNIPVGITLCEGRKALKSGSSEAAILNEHQFYWCKNKPCYENELKIKEPVNWNEYKLFNILRKIDRNINEIDYSYLLGIINKFILYLDHLKCRVCKSWFLPHQESNYGYDRINRFSCSQEGCSEKDKEVYITHCLNPKCSNIVDSRDSKKCENNWYICNYCLSCCSTEKIQIRKLIRHLTGQNGNLPQKGHDELEQIYCYKCGGITELTEVSVDRLEIDRLYNSFMEISGIKDFSKGITKTNKKWIFIKKDYYESKKDFYNKVQSFEKAGFVINTSESETGYFLTEPDLDKIIRLKCTNSNCGYNLNLSLISVVNKEKINALKFHKMIKSLFTE